MAALKFISKSLFFTCALFVSTICAAEDLYESDDLIIPKGDAVRGRKIFVDIGCVQCHQVAHDKALPIPNKGVYAPLLNFDTHTPNKLLVTAIIDPSHTIAHGFGKGNPEDAQVSSMPTFLEQMTIQQLIDITAYLKGLASNEKEMVL